MSLQNVLTDDSTTFMVDDWIAYTPNSILAKNFGVNASVFDTIPATDPYIVNSTVTTSGTPTGPAAGLFGNSSYVFHGSQNAQVPVPGGGGNLSIIDSRNFPISKTIAATVVSLEPGALRKLHWHPNVRAPYIPSTFLILTNSRRKNGYTSIPELVVLLSSLVLPTHALSISALATRLLSRPIAGTTLRTHLRRRNLFGSRSTRVIKLQIFL